MEFDENLYGRDVGIEFYRHLRPEIKFESMGGAAESAADRQYTKRPRILLAEEERSKKDEVHGD